MKTMVGETGEEEKEEKSDLCEKNNTNKLFFVNLHKHFVMSALPLFQLFTTLQFVDLKRGGRGERKKTNILMMIMTISIDELQHK